MAAMNDRVKNYVTTLRNDLNAATASSLRPKTSAETWIEEVATAAKEFRAAVQAGNGGAMRRAAVRGGGAFFMAAYESAEAQGAAEQTAPSDG